MVEKEVEIINKYGLHARPAMELVELANRYGSKIELCSGILTVDAKSIMSVMRLAATRGTVLKLTADGQDAGEAIDALVKLVGRFDELGQDQASAG
ncbi:MAG: HPr family phosphocarrier protein [Phycisphaerae bacterium]|nr:HPr family phosphocarrier protein [Phycisphaerae bacterium]